jgi:hypothetical protein
MNDVQKYWRDKVSSLLQWGAGIFILLVGWGVQQHERFAYRGTPNQKLAAFTLLAASIVYAPLLPLAIRHIYRKFLGTSEVDDTVLPFSFALLCAVVLSSLTVMVAILLSMDNE